MGSYIKSFIKKYMWAFPLVIVAIGIVYFINLFERLDHICHGIINSPTFKELQLAISIMLLITAILNWALVGYAKYIHSGACPVKRKQKRNA